jgi:hypothetical protein
VPAPGVQQAERGGDEAAYAELAAHAISPSRSKPV